VGSDSFKPPEGVRAEARKALKWISEGHAGDNFTDVGRKRAEDLARGASVSLDTVKRISSYLARHSVDSKAEGWNAGEDGYPSPGRVAWAAWGGDPAKSWTEGILKSNSKAVGGDGAMVQAIHDASIHLGAMCTPEMSEVTDEGDGAPDGANKSTFSSGSQSVTFGSHAEARQFFVDMLESIDSAEERGEELVEVRSLDPRAVLAGLDAIIDEAVDLTAGVARETLPPDVGQALDLINGAQESVRTLMSIMGVYDPDAYEKSAEFSFEKALDDVLAGSPEAPTPALVAPVPASPDASGKRIRSLGILQMSAQN
jgi:hypothetical protein